MDDSLSRIETAGSDALLVRRYENHRPPVILTLPEVGTGTWPPEVSTTVFRIVQKLLTNIARHSTMPRPSP
ncbi:hypothetical protein [Streptomyces sp. PU_AKi4]|uniref:hypothetical protein n=1 Tax=Streptomyces sp. PU_AKi4 TaxID=2800809 RepID=UPI0035257096